MEDLIVNNQLKAFQILDYDGSLVFFNGSYYVDISIDELHKINKLIESTIENYENISLNLKESNNVIREENIKFYKDICYPKKEKNTKSGIIYILKCNRTNLYKIGLTTGNIYSRVKSLKTANPSINLFKYYEKVIDLYKKEKELHDLFNKKRISGEWFNLDEKDLLDIDLFFEVIPF
jgi:hypothetical protein